MNPMDTPQSGFDFMSCTRPAPPGLKPCLPLPLLSGHLATLLFHLPSTKPAWHDTCCSSMCWRIICWCVSTFWSVASLIQHPFGSKAACFGRHLGQPAVRLGLHQHLNTTSLSNYTRFFSGNKCVGCLRHRESVCVREGEEKMGWRRK